MPFEISEIKVIRKKLGLTQTELAKLANVSQSLIAKIESGNIDPTFSNAKRIFEALEHLSNKKELKAEQLMQPRIVTVSPAETIKDAVSKMKKHEISQLPVVDDGKVVGLVSESILLDAIMNSRTGAISEVMQDAPPLVSKDASVRVISDLLKYYPIVVVGEKGRPKGVITKADLLRKVA